MVGRSALFVGSLLLPGIAFSQASLAGFHKYPQFRTMIALPGSAFPIMPDGTVDWNGAMTLSTPVAYGLAPHRWVMGISSTSNDMSLHFPRRTGDDLTEGNGGGQVLTGIDLGRAGRLTPSMLVLSGKLDTAFNLQWTAPIRAYGTQYAIGVMDISGNGGSSGEGRPGDGDNSTSFYGVVTMPLKEPGAHISVGAGTKRFQSVFGNASMNLLPMLKGYLEFDSRNVNAGVGWQVRTNQPERSLILQVGVVKGRFLSTSLNFSF